jgi:hypothetical protein
VQRPEITVGDTWRFAVENRLSPGTAEETRRVLEVTADRIVCALRSTAAGAASGRYVYTREWNLLVRPALAAAGESAEDAGQWRWSPFYPHFSFPLVEGKQWSGTAIVENRATDTRNAHRYVATVGRARRISVPAGEFDVLPVRYEADVKSDDGHAQLAWRNVEVMHYAAAANLYVQAEHTIVSPDGRLARDTVARLVEYRRG